MTCDVHIPEHYSLQIRERRNVCREFDENPEWKTTWKLNVQKRPHRHNLKLCKKRRFYLRDSIDTRQRLMINTQCGSRQHCDAFVVVFNAIFIQGLCNESLKFWKQNLADRTLKAEDATCGLAVHEKRRVGASKRSSPSCVIKTENTRRTATFQSPTNSLQYRHLRLSAHIASAPHHQPRRFSSVGTSGAFSPWVARAKS